MEPTTPTFLTVEELAARYRVTETTVHNWRKHGTAPPSFRAGRQIRFPLEGVLAWERENREPTTGGADE